MASIRKKLSMALGMNGEGSPSTSKASSMDLNRSSIDSGYHSMIAKSKRGSQDSLRQVTTFVTSGTESSPEPSPRKLRKSISTTFSGAMQAFSNTVRSTTSYIYPTVGEPELFSSEWAECETPKKQSRRSSIMSSVRSRKQRFTPRAAGAKIESPEMLQSSMLATQEKAPALDVKIPNPSFSNESTEQVSTSGGSPSLAGVKLPMTPKNLWPGPTRLTTNQTSDNGKQVMLHFISPSLDDPYVEQGDKFQHGLSFITTPSKFGLESPSPKTKKCCMGDEKEYLSEVESNADISEFNGLSPACLNYPAPGSTEAGISSPYRREDPIVSHDLLASSTFPRKGIIAPQTSSSVPSGLELSKPETLDGTTEQSASLEPPTQRSSLRMSSLEDGLNVSSPPHEAATMSKPRPLNIWLPSDVYDPDAESLESNMDSRAVWDVERKRKYMAIVDMAPDTESNVDDADAESLKSNMGSRAAWERHRADRERRYMEIADMAPDTESDEEVEPELELKRSPLKKPVYYAEELVRGAVNNGRSKIALEYPTGDLRYAVEAIERPAFPVGDLAYAVEAIDRPSVTTFDPLETVFQQRPMLPLSDTIDEPVTSQICDVLDLSPSRVDIPSSPLADPSPLRVELPSSPVSSLVRFPATPKLRIMAMRFTDKPLKTSGAGDFNGQSIRRSCSESTDVSAKSSPEQKLHTVPGDVCKGLEAEGTLVATCSSSSSKTNRVGEDAYQAGSRAAGICMPICFGHGRAVSALSNNTDDSCAITTFSPSCNAPPPFPSLHVRSEPARSISSAIEALATHGDEQIRIAGPANAGFNPSLSSPFDCPGDQTDGAGSKLFPPKALEGAESPNICGQVSSLKRHDLQSPSPGTASSVQSPSNGNTPQETFNAAKLPNFGSPSPVASRKARRKAKKSSSGMETSRYGRLGRRNRSNSDQARAEEFTENAGGSVHLFDPNSKSTSGKKNPGGKKQAAATLLLGSSPSPKRMPRRGDRSSSQFYENAESAAKYSKSRFEPEYSIKHFGSMSEILPWYPPSSGHSNSRVGSTSYAGYELDRVLRASPPECSYHHPDKDLQKVSEKKAIHLASTDEIIGNDMGPSKDTSRVPGPTKKGESPSEAEKKSAIPTESKRKYNHACSRPNKLKSGTLGDDHVHEDELSPKGGRPPWRH